MGRGIGRARRAVVLVALALVVVALGAPAAAQTGPTLHVDRANPNCSESGPGTAALPLCTISAGATRSTAGTTVLVHAATYPEQVSPKSGAPGAPIVFKAAPGGTPVVTGQTNGFYLSSKSWVTIEGFKVTGTTSDAIYVSKSDHINVIDNELSFAGQPASGKVAKGLRFNATTDSVAVGNHVHHNTDYGIYVLSDSTRNTIAQNEIHDNARGYTRAASGIRLHDSSSNTIAANVSYDNEDSGIELVTGSSNNVVVNNVTYDNGDHGIDIYKAIGQRVVANTIYRNLTAGLNAEEGSTSTYIANNVSVDNAIDGPRTRGNIRVDSTSRSGTTLNYDLVHLSAPSTLLVWGSTNYTALSAFRAATGQEASGIEAAPLFANPSAGDFRLTGGSPAIDSANSGATAQPSTDNEGLPRVDILATPNTGAGPRPYDDRGALEYQLVDSAPSAALSVSPGSGLVALTVTANASASTDPDPGSPIASYEFDFGDGSAAVGPQPGATAPHTYTTPGAYTVTVTVRDTHGLASTATRPVLVTNNAPVAALSVTPSSGAAPLQVTANASGSSDTDGAPIASYAFDFGDGSPSVGPQPGATASHTYTSGGSFTVTVTVRDTAGLSSTATATVVVSQNGDDPPSAALSVSPGSGLVALTVTANASASTDPDPGSPIASYEFDFGDGSAAVGPQPGATAPHTYTTPGAYTVTVTVRDTHGLASTATRPVLVTNNAPVAALSVTPSSGAAPLQVTANASGSSDTDGAPIASYAFDFGDGSPSVGPQPGATASHTYTSGGSFTVTVTVRDTAGLSSTATATVSVQANLVGNPSFETDTSGWNISGSGANISLTRVLGGHDGSWAARLANTGTTASTCLLNDSPNWVHTVSGTYTASLWVRAASPGAVLKLRLREYDAAFGLVNSGLTQVTLTTAWQKVSLSYTPLAPGSTTLDFNAYVTSAAPGTCFYADSVFAGLS